MDRSAILSSPPRDGNALIIPAENEACVECRSRKRKCVRSASDNHICDRCLASGSICVFSRARPGRKRRRTSPDKQQVSFEAPSASAGLSKSIEYAVDTRDSPSQTVNRTTTGELLSSGLYTGSHTYSTPRSGSERHASREPAHASYRAHASHPYIASEGFSLQGVLNEAARNTAQSSSVAPSADVVFHKSPLNELEADRSLAGSLASPGDARRRAIVELPKLDLVSIGAISTQTATELFRYFFGYMNPVIAILDEQLHGYPRVIDRSNLLSSAIMAVSAKVCRPELYLRALDAATNLMSLAFERNACNLEFVQALSIMVFWRSADDDSGWRKTGYAIRMAFELGLHRIRRHPLPPDPSECRELLNRERTWIQLCCADINFSLQCTLPPMILDDGLSDFVSWFREHAVKYPCPSEAVLQPSFLLLRIVRSHADLIHLQSKGAELSLLLDQVERQHAQWQADWIDPDNTNLGTITDHQLGGVIFASRHLAFKIAEFRLELQTTDYDIAFAKAQDAVIGVIAAFLRLGRLGLLPYCQDMVFIGMVSCVIWLHNRSQNISPLCSRTLHGRVVEVIQTVEDIKTGTTDIGGRTARLLRVVCRAGSPRLQGPIYTSDNASASIPLVDIPRSTEAQEAEFSAFLESHLAHQDLDFWSNWFQT